MAARTSFRSVPEMWLHRISSTPDSDAFQYPTVAGWKTTLECARSSGAG